MSSTILSDFEQQYSVQTAEITARIGRLQHLNKTEQITGIKDVQCLLMEVENLLEQMEIAVHELDPSRFHMSFRSH